MRKEERKMGDFSSSHVRIVKKWEWEREGNLGEKVLKMLMLPWDPEPLDEKETSPNPCLEINKP